MNPSNPGFPYLSSLFLTGLGGSLSLNYLARLSPTFSNFSAAILFLVGVGIFLVFTISNFSTDFPKLFLECQSEILKIFCILILASVLIGSLLAWVL